MFYPSENHSKLLRLDYYRRMPDGYPYGWYEDGNGLDIRTQMTGFHRWEGRSNRDRKPFRHHLDCLSFDYTELNPDPARVTPIAVRLGDKQWV